MNRTVAYNAVSSAIVGGLLTRYVMGSTSDINYFGIDLNAPTAVAIAVGASSIVTDYTNEMILKRLGINGQIINASVLATQVGIAGASTTALLYFGSDVQPSIVNSFLLGAGGKLMGDYASNKLFNIRDGIIGSMIF
jgi:hypothetical protein